ncbi:hypothetical protein [Tenacibaculum maritimum]|uniref:hypothetical protein n=1 Tax=Tenacibaculum maritimum TaxID=107401 RepID=UPI0038763CB9
MHKKLAADLTSLAHSILQMKNKEDVLILKEKAYLVYEKLSVLAYVEEYINTTPNAIYTKEELLTKIAKASEIQENKKNIELENPITSSEQQEVNTATKEILSEKPIVNTIASKEHQEIIEQPFDELQKMLFSDDEVKNDAKDIGFSKVPPTLEEELKDTISVDAVVDLFEKATPRKSLNDQLQSTIQIGLNDRIAFVKHLFDGNQSDFNRVISQLNTFKTENEAKKFINKMVKPDYNWSEKEEYETRLIEIIERRFI